MLRLWERIRPGKDRPTRLSIALGLVFAVVVGLATSWDFQRSAEHPRERATIVARHEVAPNICPGNGRRDWETKWDVTWRSANPPKGLPAKFVEKNVCDWNEVGDKVEIIRVIDNGRVTVAEDVPHSGREALELALSTFALVFSISLPIAWLWLGASRWRRRVRSR